MHSLEIVIYNNVKCTVNTLLTEYCFLDLRFLHGVLGEFADDVSRKFTSHTVQKPQNQKTILSIYHFTSRNGVASYKPLSVPHIRMWQCSVCWFFRNASVPALDAGTPVSGHGIVCSWRQAAGSRVQKGQRVATIATDNARCLGVRGVGRARASILMFRGRSDALCLQHGSAECIHLSDVIGLGNVSEKQGTRERSGAHRGVVGKPEGKRQRGKPKTRWENNIEMDLYCLHPIVLYDEVLKLKYMFSYRHNNMLLLLLLLFI